MPKYEKIHCNECSHKTKHLLVATREQHGSEPYDEEYDISWDTIYDMFECCGCEEVTLRSKHYFSEWNSGDVKIVYYPPRVARHLPPWSNKLPKEITELLEEVYTALQADSIALSMMGARALIDMVILKEVGDVGTFAQKLNKLESEGVLSKVSKQVLEVALDVGNAASHRGYKPQAKHVDTVIDIVEHLLQSTVLKEEIVALKKATPKRAKKKIEKST